MEYDNYMNAFESYSDPFIRWIFQKMTPAVYDFMKDRKLIRYTLWMLLKAIPIHFQDGFSKQKSPLMVEVGQKTD